MEIQYERANRFHELSEVAKIKATEEVWENERKLLPMQNLTPNAIEILTKFFIRLNNWGVSIDKHQNRISMEQEEPWKFEVLGDLNLTTVFFNILQLVKKKRRDAYTTFMAIRELKRVDYVFSLSEFWLKHPFDGKVTTNYSTISNFFPNTAILKNEMKFIMDYDKEELVRDKYAFIDLFLEEGGTYANEKLPGQLLKDVQLVAKKRLKEVVQEVNQYIEEKIDELKKELQFEMAKETQLAYFRTELENNFWQKYHFDETGSIAAEFLKFRNEYEKKFEKWAFYENMKRDNPRLYHEIFPNERHA